LPEERQRAVRPEIQRLQQMAPTERAARIKTREFQRLYSAPERELIEKLSSPFVPKEKSEY